MATYYVDTAVGDDANAGTSEGSGNAWATIDKAMNTLAANDKVWVKASGNYNELATIDTAGTAGNQVVFEGYTSTTGDGGQVTMDGQSARANCLTSSLGANTRQHYIFKNFRFTGATGDGVAFGGSQRFCRFTNCRFDNNGSEGFFANGTEWAFDHCQFDNNTDDGCSSANSTCHIANTSFANGTHQIEAGAYSVVFGCLIYEPDASGIMLNYGTGSHVTVINNTFDGDNIASRCLDFGGSYSFIAVVNNIFYDCADASGAVVSDYDHTEMYISFNNLVNDNTSNYSNFVTHSGEVTTAPSFTDEASNDYTLGASSPALEAGLDAGAGLGGTSYIDIGAIQRQPAAGGGGGGVRNPTGGPVG